MKFFVAVMSVYLAANAATAQTMTITGTVRNLDGIPLATQNFTVKAFQGGVEVASGALVSATTYSIAIDSARVNAADVRVTLSFRATGRDLVDFEKIAGRAAILVGVTVTPVNSAQTIDVVMPEATPCYWPSYSYDACCHPWKRWSGHKFKK